MASTDGNLQDQVGSTARPQLNATGCVARGGCPITTTGFGLGFSKDPWVKTVKETLVSWFQAIPHFDDNGYKFGRLGRAWDKVRGGVFLGSGWKVGFVKVGEVNGLLQNVFQILSNICWGAGSVDRWCDHLGSEWQWQNSRSDGPILEAVQSRPVDLLLTRARKTIAVRALSRAFVFIDSVRAKGDHRSSALLGTVVCGAAWVGERAGQITKKVDDGQDEPKFPDDCPFCLGVLGTPLHAYWTCPCLHKSVDGDGKAGAALSDSQYLVSTAEARAEVNAVFSA